MDTLTIFISYSHHDKPWVCEWLLSHLEAVGLKVLIDYRDFAMGTPLRLPAGTNAIGRPQGCVPTN